MHSHSHSLTYLTNQLTYLCKRAFEKRKCLSLSGTSQPSQEEEGKGGGGCCMHALALSYCLSARVRVCSTRPPGKRVWVEDWWGGGFLPQPILYKYLRNRSLTIIRRSAPRCCSPGRQDSCVKRFSDDVLPKELPG